MLSRIPAVRLLTAVGVAVAVAACADASTSPSSTLSAPGAALASKSGGGGGGGGGGAGAGAAVPGPLTSPVPTTPPAPDVLMRESFGENDGARPSSGDGALRASVGSVPLKSFWIEYPGSKNTQWLASDVGQKWQFNGAGLVSQNPFELPTTYQYGDVFSLSPVFPTSFPTALMPITVALPSGGYEYSMEGWPETTPGAYIAIGFTNSSLLASNLTSGGSLWLKVTDPSGTGLPLHYELRTGSLATGKLLLAGDGGMRGWNHMALRVSPAAGTVTLNFGTVVHNDVFDYADTTSVTVPATIPQPRYLAFEGIGVLSNFMLRK